MERLNLIIEQYGQWYELRTYTDRIDTYVQSDFSVALENSKSLLESICKQICESKGEPIDPNASINNVLKKAFTAIGYPSSTPVTQISSSLVTIGQQMGTLRNEIGSTSHGRSLEELKERNSKVDEMTKELLIDTTVIVASFLIRNFENENPKPAHGTSEQKILLTENQDFNDFWDEDYGEFIMGDYSYTASEVLYYTDYEAYLTELKAFREGDN
jgi:hypothetical protein